MPSISLYSFNSSPILESLPEQELQMFREHLKLIKVKKGRVLCKEGEFPKAVYIIKRGKVKLYQQALSGSEKILYIYTPGEMFGYRPVLCNQKHPATAETIEDSSVYKLPIQHFLKILQHSTGLSNYLLNNLSHEFTVLINRIGAFSQKSVKERVALTLLIMREKYRKKDNDGEPEISLSRTDLAAYVGTSIETVARIITKLKIDKVIKTNGRKIVVIDDRALHELTG